MCSIFLQVQAFQTKMGNGVAVLTLTWSHKCDCEDRVMALYPFTFALKEIRHLISEELNNF
jgi:hypothetical protein